MFHWSPYRASVRSVFFGPRPADHDRQAALDGTRLDQRVVHPVRGALVVRDLLAVEQPPQEPHRLVEAVEPLPEARSEVDPEGLVLALEPGAADAEDRPAARLRWSSVTASFAVSPGLRNVFAPTIRPSVARLVTCDQPASTDQPSRIGPSHGPTMLLRWSQVQRLAAPACSARTAASRMDGQSAVCGHRRNPILTGAGAAGVCRHLSRPRGGRGRR